MSTPPSSNEHTVPPSSRALSSSSRRNGTKKLVALLALFAVGCIILSLDISNTGRFVPSVSELLAEVAPSLMINASDNNGALNSAASQSIVLDPQRPGSLFDPTQVTPQCARNNSNNSTRRRVIDVIWVNSELPSLELRLNELWNVVDTFFINESTISWKAIPLKNQTIAPKPLYLTEHMADFEQFKSKIVIHVIPPEISSQTTYTGSYAIEMAQRDQVWPGIQRLLPDLQPQDLIMFADLDEIPRPEIIEKLACDPPDQLPRTPICLSTTQGFFYYNYKCRIRNEWTIRPRLLQYKDAKDNPDERMKQQCTMIPDASTHCSSCFGSLELVRKKILSNADELPNDPNMLNTDSILDRVRNCKDVYLRHHLDRTMEKLEKVDFDKVPGIVAKYPDRWGYLLGRGPLYEDGNGTV
jgi:beta-1,4-mannosyl-glycoprotein beta-1,4-N-acetylglucosaminyltransferase